MEKLYHFIHLSGIMKTHNFKKGCRSVKKIIALMTALAMLLSFAGCQNQGTTPSDGKTESFSFENIVDKNIFPESEMYNYTKKADVPDYKVEPGLGNVVNKNQFKQGTDEVGDFYFATDLSPQSEKLLEKNGFVVLDNTSSNEFYGRYERNRYNFVPNFVTTDSAVHTFHLMYDYVLKDVERTKLSDTLKSLTNTMLEKSCEQYDSLKGTAFENAALRNVGYFSVAAKLLDENHQVKEEVKDLVEKELSLIKEHNGIAPSPLVNYRQDFEDPNDIYNVDYSQFIPRGHYIYSQELENYFKASMWYGQITMRSKNDDEIRSALLMTSALRSGGIADWYRIFSVINFFVGECDDITALDYLSALEDVYAEDIVRLEFLKDEEKFKKAAEKIRALPPPMINSVPIYGESIEPDRDEAVTGFRFLGQRFTVDAHIIQRLIERDTKNRYLPTALDIPAAFGSDEALEILKRDYNMESYEKYMENMESVRKYVADTDDKTWTSNLYWSWLNMLRPLSDGANGKGYPFFMQNKAWLLKELNTFAASWTELKHDTILYAKQPMAEMGGGGGEPPAPPDDRGYVEPNPQLFGRLSLLVKQTKEGLKKAELITDEAEGALDNLFKISERLRDISIKELENKEITAEDYEFIRNYGAELEHIWDVAKKDELDAWEKEMGYNVNKESYLYFHPDAVIADVATDPNNNLALEEATGYAKNIVVAFLRDGEVALGLGTVFSHYEFTVPMSERMTDEDWHQKLREGEKIPVDNWKKEFTSFE